MKITDKGEAVRDALLFTSVSSATSEVMCLWLYGDKEFSVAFLIVGLGAFLLLPTAKKGK